MKRYLLSMGLTLAMIGVLLSGCAIPKVPSDVSWDTELNLPIASRVYRLSDIADADSVLQSETSGIGMTLPDSALYFTCRRDLEPIQVGDNLKLDAMDYEIEHSLSALRVAMNVNQTQVTSLASLNPDLAARHGMTMDVPAFPFLVILEVPLGADFVSACIDSGRVQVSIENSLPYAINSTMIEWMADRDHPANLYSGNLPSAADTSYSNSLEGQCLSQTMYIEVSGMAAGGNQMRIDSTQGVSINLFVGETLVNRYRGRIQRQEIVRDSVYALNQQHEVNSGLIAEGHLTIHATNQTTLDDSVRLTLVNLTDTQGSTVEIQQFLRAGESRNIALNIAGYTFHSLNGLQQVRGILNTLILATTEDVDYIAGEQRVTADFSTDELHFSRFDGVLHDLQLDVDRDSADVEQPPEGWENVHPAALDMFMHLQCAVPVQATMNVNLASQRNGSTIGSENRSAVAWLGSDTTLVFRNLTGLVPTLPDWISYSGRAMLNGSVVVHDTSTIRGSIVLTAPLTFTLENTHIPGDVQKADPDATEDVQQVELTIRLWNALPMSGVLKLIAASDSLAVLDGSGQPADTLCVVTLPAAVISGGRVSGSGYREVIVSPPDGFYDLLQHPPFYIRPDLTLNGSEGDTLSAYGSDYVRFSATARVIYRVSSEN
jgi:hypothetical protein